MLNKRTPGTPATGSQTGKSRPDVRTFTKEQVSNLMRKRVERSHKSFFDRYGVKDLTELDNLVGKSRSYEATLKLYDELKKNNDDLTTQHADLVKKYAFKAGNVNPDKYNDIETYFKGKNLVIDENSLNEELKSHPDWLNKANTIETLGPEPTPSPGLDERAIASQYFGVDLTK